MQIRCPHCHCPIELVDESSLSDVYCDSCGSSFDLVEKATETFHSTHRSIGHFELIQKLGTGAFGSVWKAKDTKLDRFVAVKLPRQDRLTADDAEKFLREARSASQLRHANIVSVHEVGREDDQLYIVSELIEGVSLADWLTSHQLTCREAAELCAKIAQAVHYAHEQGVIHRDLKPANIILNADGEPHVMDFGLAKRDAGEITMTMEGQILGTPAYMSPEQAQGLGHAADRRSDVYSLGVILFELISGELPFRGNSRMLLHQVIHDDPPSPRTLNNHVPNDLQTICLKCLHKDPERRYATAKALQTDLENWLAGMPISARPVSQIEKAWRWCRRRPAVSSLALLLVVSLVLGVSGIVWQWREAVDATERERIAKQQAETKATQAREASVRVAQANRKLARQLYSTHISNAHMLWGVNELERAKATLLQSSTESNSEELRGFEWSYIWELCHPEKLSFDENIGGFSAVACAPDGKTIATGDRSGQVRLWEANGGSQNRELFQCPAAISCLAFSPIDSILAIADTEGRLELWDMEANELIHAIDIEASKINDLAFHPAGHLLACASQLARETGGEVSLWKVATGENVAVSKPFSAPANGLTFSPGGHWLAATESISPLAEPSHGAEVRIWSADSLLPQSTFPASNAGRLALAFHPDEASLIGIGFEAQLRKCQLLKWDMESGEVRERVDLGLDVPGAMELSPDGSQLATGGTNFVRLWSLGAKIVQTDRFYAQSSLVTHIAYSPAGSSLVTAGMSESDVIKVHELDSVANPVKLLDHDTWVGAVAHSPDGVYLATGSQRIAPRAVPKLVVYRRDDWQIHKEIRLPETGIESLAYSPDGSLLAAGCDDGSIKIFETEGFTLQENLQSRKIAVTRILFTPDGKHLVSADGEFRRVSEDGTYFDNVRMKGEIRIWNVDANEVVRTIDQFSSAISWFDCDPNRNELGVTCTDGTVSFWNWETGAREKELKCFDTSATVICFDPQDRNAFAVAGDGNRAQDVGTIKIFNRNDWIERITIPAHSRPVTSMTFSPCGRSLVTTAFNRKVRFWDPVEGLMRLELEADQINQLSFAPDGRALAAATTSKNTTVWWYRDE